jgi:hypothetical protein
MGKSCVRFKKLDDLAQDVIGNSIRCMSARGFIDYYESTLKNELRKSRGKKGAAGSKTTKRRAKSG